MKRLLKYLLIVLCICTFNIVLTSCELEKITQISLNEDSAEVYIGEFNFDDYELTVDYSSGREDKLKLNEDMISPADRIKLYQEGEHTITVNYQNRTFRLNVKVLRNVFRDVEFSDVVTTYTGENVILTATNLPEGTEVTYPDGYSYRNAGEYTVTAILRKDGYEMTTLTANLTINKADYDLSGVVFEDKTEVYDGTTKDLKIIGDLPVGLNASYTITKSDGRVTAGYSATNSGRYTITASFMGDYENYNRLEDKSAVLVIQKADMDMSGIVMEDLTVTYDMLSHSIKVDETKLPAGVYVNYQNNEHVDAGEYIAVAKFSILDNINYNEIPDITAKLTIEKAVYDMSDIYFDNDRVTYDGLEHTLRIKGTLPGLLEVNYINNENVNAGTHSVTAYFINNNKNYVTPENIVATLVIEPLAVNMAEVEQESLCLLDVYKLLSYYPSNVPEFVEVEKVVYYKVDSKVEDLTEFDGVTGDILYEIPYYRDSDEIDFEEYLKMVSDIAEKFDDGYYVAVSVYKDNPNLKNLSYTKSQLKIMNCDESFYSIYIDKNYEDENGNIITVFRDGKNPDIVLVKTKDNGEIEYIKNGVDLIMAGKNELEVSWQKIIELDYSLTDDAFIDLLLNFQDNENIVGFKRIEKVGDYYVATRFNDIEGFTVQTLFTFVMVEDYADYIPEENTDNPVNFIN